MECEDHCYTNGATSSVSPAEFTHKMTSKEIKDFVALRVANNHLFSGKRNTTRAAWRAILRQLGLQQRMTHRQASRKWENMKKRYKGLKNPPNGAAVLPDSWRYFNLMEAAMSRLDGSAANLPYPKDKSDSLSIARARKRRGVMDTSSPSGSVEIEVSLNGDDEEQDQGQDLNHIMQEVEDQRSVMDGERRGIEREKQLLERERQVLQRERSVLDREAATLERDRASLERERAMLEREKELMEKDKATIEKDREAVTKDRLDLDREKVRLERRCTATSEMNTDANVTDMNRKERFLYMFEKLIEDF